MAYTTIDDPSAHFQVAPTWTGGTSAKTLTNDGNSDLQPDLVWIKCRNASQPHSITDSSRGTSKSLTAAGTAAEVDDSRFTSFNTDGFTLAGSSGPVNTSGGEYVGWQWKANGGSTSSVSESGSGDGGINACTYQANTTAGFSIIKYTGHRGSGIGDNNHTNVTHGLSSAPTFVIIKNLTTGHTLDWQVMGNNLGGFSNYHLHLNTTAARSGATYVANTAPSSDYVFVGNNNDVNYDGLEFIMYAWHEVQGYSKFGSYEGNGDANGTFVYTGFKPAWLVVKGIDSTGAWYIVDNRRNLYNLTDLHIPTNNEGGESSSSSGLHVDLLSNGFKLRTNYTDTNEAGETFTYAAFAEQPFVTSGGVPATAR